MKLMKAQCYSLEIKETHSWTQLFVPHLLGWSLECNIFILHDSFSCIFYSTRKRSYCRKLRSTKKEKEECFIFHSGICNSFYLQKAALGLTWSSDKPELNVGFPREKQIEKTFSAADIFCQLVICGTSTATDSALFVESPAPGTFPNKIISKNVCFAEAILKSWLNPGLLFEKRES